MTIHAMILMALAAFASMVMSPAAAADIDHGRQLARRWCAACHVVASNEGTTATEASSFETIARKTDFDEKRLATFLLDPHPKMPDMSLTRIETTDLAAYINSLKP